jgi:spore coat polysaccharide biosynthesis protein SpsF
MEKKMRKKTEQEKFWAQSFGDNYTYRNIKSSNRIYTTGRHLLDNNVLINEALELGANVGYNLDAIKTIYPNTKTYGVEINKKAYLIGKKKHAYYNKSAYDFKSSKKFDLVFCSGVLIHQNPKNLLKFYKKLFTLSKKFIYLSEYFNPTPIMINYRGNKDKLYKRDFAKEFWNLYPKLTLLDYGFHWKEDPTLKNCCDNSNWFLFKKGK